MAKVERLGIFGGSFNPPTQTHLMLAEHLLERYIDRVLFLPVGDAYAKPDLLPAAHRVAMLRLVLKDNPRFSLSEYETNRPGLNFTYDTLMALRQEYSEADLFFMLGSDQLPGISGWHRSEDLLQTFRFILLVRSEDSPEELFRADPYLERFRDRFHISVDHPRSNLSSSMIRTRLARGESIRYLTDKSVIEYIERHNLYR